MLHTRNTLQKQKGYTFKTSNLHHRVLRVVVHLVHLPLHQQTVVYIRNQEVPKTVLLRINEAGKITHRKERRELLRRKVSSMEQGVAKNTHVGLNLTESEQDGEESGREQEPESLE